MNLFLVCDYAYVVTVSFLEIANFLPGETEGNYDMKISDLCAVFCLKQKFYVMEVQDEAQQWDGHFCTLSACSRSCEFFYFFFSLQAYHCAPLCACEIRYCISRSAGFTSSLSHPGPVVTVHFYRKVRLRIRRQYRLLLHYPLLARFELLYDYEMYNENINLKSSPNSLL